MIISSEDIRFLYTVIDGYSFTTRMRMMKNVVFASDLDNETPSSSDANSVIGSLSLSLPIFLSLALFLGSWDVVECMDTHGLGF